MSRLAHISDFSVLSCMLELGNILLDDVYYFHMPGVWCLQLPTGGIQAPENAQPLAVISAAPWGSALILPILHSYISMMGSQDLTDAFRITILNANYMAKHLEVSCHRQMNLDLVWSRVRVGHPSCRIPWGTGKLLPHRWLFISYGNKKVELWQYVWFCDRIITQYCSVVWMEHVHMSSSLTCKHSRFFAIQMCACID
jgi:hypothetical protein